MTFDLDQIADCFDGIMPSVIASVGADGMPNVTFLSVVHRLDGSRIGLSFQFFNKTHRNIAVNPHVRILLFSPTSGTNYLLLARYVERWTSGPEFDRMAAKVRAAGAMTGVPDRFRLAGVDVYEVLGGETVGEPPQSSRAAAGSVLQTAIQISQAIGMRETLEDMIDALFLGVLDGFGFQHVMLLVPEPESDRLVTLASQGYEQSGVGSEARLGQGIIGQAAARREAIRIAHWTRERLMAGAIDQRLKESGEIGAFAQQIPLPGLDNVESMLAVPMVAGNRLAGVLYWESVETLRYTADHEQALVLLASQLAAGLMATDHPPEPIGTAAAPAAAGGQPSPARRTVKRYEADNSVFIDHDYLIKGVAGAVLWVLLEDYVKHGQTEFSNRELRADPRLVLPDVVDNLETRLILLRRRLDDRRAGIRLEKTGRGRFRLHVQGELSLKSLAKP